MNEPSLGLAATVSNDFVSLVLSSKRELPNPLPLTLNP